MSTYTSSAPSLKIPGDPTIQFVNGTFDTDEEDVVKYLDGLIETRPNISQLVRKLDREAAEKIALAHQATVQANKGMVDSSNLAESNSATAEMLARDKQLHGLKTDQVEGDLQLTESGAGKVVTDNGDGFIPTPTPATSATTETAPVEPVAEVPAPAKTATPAQAVNILNLNK